MRRKTILQTIVLSFFFCFLSASPVFAAACTFPPEQTSTLKAYARIKNLLIGALNPAYAEHAIDGWVPLALKEFDILATHAGGLIGVEPKVGNSFINMNELIYAQSIAAQGIKIKSYFTGHTAEPQLPWLASYCHNNNLTPDKARQIIHLFWDTLVDKDNGTFYERIPLNEDAIHDPTKNLAGCFGQVLGEEGAYIELYKYAHLKDPKAILTFMDTWPNPYVIPFVVNLKSKGAPIDAIAIEMHMGQDFAINPKQMDKLVATMSAFMNDANTHGLKVEISEITVPSDGTPQQEKVQANAYKLLMKTCLQHSNCFEFLFWSNYTRNAGNSPSYGGTSALFDANLSRKLAYYAVMDALREDTTRGCFNNTTPTPTPTPTPIRKPGDLDGNGKVDILDYNILVSNFGHPYTITDWITLKANFGK